MPSGVDPVRVHTRPRAMRKRPRWPCAAGDPSPKATEPVVEPTPSVEVAVGPAVTAATAPETTVGPAGPPLPYVMGSDGVPRRSPGQLRCEEMARSVLAEDGMQSILRGVQLRTGEAVSFVCTKLHPLCSKTARALFTSPPSQITLCHEQILSTRDMREVIRHELTHANDYLLLDMELGDCDGLACSEIRAAREAECGGKPSALLSALPAVQQFFHKRCTADTARRSVKVCFPDKYRKCVDRMFDECFASSKLYERSATVSDTDSAVGSRHAPPPTPHKPVAVPSS